MTTSAPLSVAAAHRKAQTGFRWRAPAGFGRLTSAVTPSRRCTRRTGADGSTSRQASSPATRGAGGGHGVGRPSRTIGGRRPSVTHDSLRCLRRPAISISATCSTPSGSGRRRARPARTPACCFASRITIGKESARYEAASSKISRGSASPPTPDGAPERATRDLRRGPRHASTPRPGLRVRVLAHRYRGPRIPARAPEKPAGNTGPGFASGSTMRSNGSMICASGRRRSNRRRSAATCWPAIATATGPISSPSSSTTGSRASTGRPWRGSARLDGQADPARPAAGPPRAAASSCIIR